LAVKFRDEIAAKMTPAQIVEAQRMAARMGSEVKAKMKALLIAGALTLACCRAKSSRSRNGLGRNGDAVNDFGSR
jgi:hypothetical protein